MCGRYTVTRHEQIVEDMEASLELALEEPRDAAPGGVRPPAPPVETDGTPAIHPWWKPRWNVAPTQPAPVVIARGDARVVELMRWGLVPHWAGAPGKKPPLMINARLESLNAKQVFRDALARKRCLVPADGFYEWTPATVDAGGKQPPQPFYFHPRDGALFAFAGLWARMRDDRGGELHSFTIITGRAGDLVRPIHDRMPIVLPRDAWAGWLDPALDGEAARGLLSPRLDDGWTRDAVSTWVNKADHDDPRCIAPAAPAPQPRLL